MNRKRGINHKTNKKVRRTMVKMSTKNLREKLPKLKSIVIKVKTT